MKRIFLSSLVCAMVFSAGVLRASTDVKLKLGSDGYNLDFAAPAFKIQSVDQYGLPTSSAGIYTSIVLLDDYNHATTDLGKPAVPFIQFELAIYDENSVPEVEVSDVVEETMELANHIYPAQVEWPRSIPLETRPFNIDYNYYCSSGTRGPVVTIGEATTIRDLKTVTITIYPFFYSPALKNLTVAKAMKIHFKTPVNRKIKPCDSPQWENFLRFVCPNYDLIVEPLRNSPKENYLIITNTKYVATLKPFTDEKTIKYNVQVVTNTADGAGTTSAEIQAYIKKQYDDPAKKPAFLLLVGQGSDVPLGVSGSSATDNPYGSLTGVGDWKAEIFYGRFDVTTVDELTNIINKTLYMEKNIGKLPKKAVLIGGTDAGSGKIAEGTMDFTDTTYLKKLGFTSLKLYTNSDKTATKAKLVTAINEGVIWSLYSGHGSATSWAVGPWSYSTSDPKTNTNTTSFPFSAGHACYTGSFQNSTCFASSSIRPKGCFVANYGSVQMTSWGPDDKVQRGMIEAVKAKVYAFGAAYFAGQVKNNSAGYMKQYNLFGDPSLWVEQDPIFVTTQIKADDKVAAVRPLYQVNAGNLTVDISYKGAHSIELLNPMGRSIATYKGVGIARYALPKTLGTGMYLLRITADRQSVVRVPVFRK